MAVYQRQPGHNNIAIGMDCLVIALALYTDQLAQARDQINQLTKGRIDSQIEPDGRLPHELERTLSFSYSIKTLNSFFIAARLAEHVGIDLWNYEGPDGQSIRKGLDFLIPYCYEPEKWPYPQIKDLISQPAGIVRHLLPLAIRAWPEEAYKNTYRHISRKGVAKEEWLIYCGLLLKEGK